MQVIVTPASSVINSNGSSTANPAFSSSSLLPTPTSAMHGLALLASVPSSSMHRIIINKLMDMPFHQFELALLQLVHAVVTHKCSRTDECLLSLRRLLCRLCSQSLHLGVKLLWTIEAFAPNAAKSSKSALEGLRELLEAAAVNGTEEQGGGYGGSSDDNNNNNTDRNSSTTPPTRSNNNSFGGMPSGGSMPSNSHHTGGTPTGSLSNNNSFSNSNNILTEQEEILVHLKMGRLSVLNDQRLFFQQLVGISDFLRKITDRGSRGDQLRLQLLQMASSVPQRRVFMPFSSSNQRPRWIVRILPDEAIVFSSRERAPYLLVVETVTSPPITVNHTNSSSDQIYDNNNNDDDDDGDDRDDSNHHHNHHHKNGRNGDEFVSATNEETPRRSGGGGARSVIKNAISSLLPNSITGANDNNHRQNEDDHHHTHHSSSSSSSSSVISPNMRNTNSRSSRRSSFAHNNNSNTNQQRGNNNNNNTKKRLFYKMCGDPDVREQSSLSLIGRNSNNFHVYAKKFNSKLCADPWKESTLDRRNRIKESSPFSHLPGWNVEALVIKAGDDLTQEQVALQVVDLLHRIWKKHEVPVFVLPYQALSTVYDGGLIECINDAISIDSLKKAAGVQTLHQFFLKIYGEGTQNFAIAQRNFIESMAGYSVACFLMMVKDRHNANLMLTRSGHLVHIDFGFMFGTSPGNIQFENAPFKMSQELLDTMGGANSEGFRYFKVLLHLALSAVREEADQLVQLISVIAPRSGIKCFGTSDVQAKAVVDGLKQRLGMNIGNMFQSSVVLVGGVGSENDGANNINNNNAGGGYGTATIDPNQSSPSSNLVPVVMKRNAAAAVGVMNSFERQNEDEVAVARYVRELVESSNSNWRTTRYDQFQTWQNGII